MHEKLKPYAPLLLRLSLAVVFLLFGYQKLSSPSQTRAEIQLLLDIGLGGAAAINFYLGLFEVLIALSFVFGVFVRYSAGLASLFLMGFFSSFLWKYGLSIDPTLYRDLGLLGATLALHLWGAGPVSVDSWLEKREITQ